MDAKDSIRGSAQTPQSVDALLTSSASFVVLKANDSVEDTATIRDVLSSMEDLVKNVGFRDTSAQLSCTVGVGSRIFTRIFARNVPAELHPFKEFRGAKHTAPSTEGDILLHVRAERDDLVFELVRQITEQFGDAARVVDEVSGFRYFDSRDLLGFVDGTANPVGPNLPESTLVGAEDPEFAGGSYVVVQKYLHDMKAWRSLDTATQEAIIGRTKPDNIELPDAVEGQKSHKTLATITDESGEHDILRDNMPFGKAGAGEFGTYFIGYTRRLWVLEKMLERMFIGDPAGTYDRILDFSTPHTGVTFFAPTATMLAELG